MRVNKELYKMDANIIISLVGSLGFPIVCALICFWFINSTMKDLQKRTEENTESLKKLITLVESIIRKEIDDK